ncbi:hypothetical protein D039_2101 [Vibrio parahaemolyticus EKP-028]|nr:hypothetical protein D039_2101 [Vibrio parahaemolyticus EKP-028]
MRHNKLFFRGFQFLGHSYFAKFSSFGGDFLHLTFPHNTCAISHN